MLWSLEFHFAGETALGCPFPQEGSSFGACHASLLWAAQLRKTASQEKLQQNQQRHYKAPNPPKQHKNWAVVCASYVNNDFQF